MSSEFDLIWGHKTHFLRIHLLGPWIRMPDKRGDYVPGTGNQLPSENPLGLGIKGGSRQTRDEWCQLSYQQGIDSVSALFED
ncbi:hypothetical protein CDAR_588271 [Caerostris darwini]|uniref:Uncharacterized protein n=1 Tax=Caerostris darwini TaxID=1538125 RepID=A0AAV4S8W7_9ARAC|nr:hypothetical protein CDAR_588271 [Caerostris darwini]